MEDEIEDALSRYQRSDKNEDGAAIALLCKLVDGSEHTIKLKNEDNSVQIKDGMLYVWADVYFRWHVFVYS